MPRRRSVLAAGLVLAAPALIGRAIAQEAPPSGFDDIRARAEGLEQLHTLTVARQGEVLFDEGFHGARASAPTNIKSASKSLISTLVGIAIDKGLLAGVDQPIAPILADDLPADPEPRMAKITIDHLLTMQAGLAPTSGPNYGRWVQSRNWVRAALAQPFVAEPGTGWQYSTGSTHLLSAILTRVGGRSTRALAEEWLGDLPGFAIAGWDRDPQGIYLGGNQLAMTPASLLALGELIRNDGRGPDGAQVVSASWVATSGTPHARSFRRGDDYGYCWFLRDFAGMRGRYAWGFGGQMLYIVPDAGVSIVMTSEEVRSARSGYLDDLNEMAGDIVGMLAG